MRCQEIINSAQNRQEVKILDYTKVVDIQILNLEERIFNIMIRYAKIFSDGHTEVCRRNVKYLGGYYEGLKAKPVVSAAYIGKVYCGVLRNDPRLLFMIHLSDGSVQLIQAREGSAESMKLFSRG